MSDKIQELRAMLTTVTPRPWCANAIKTMIRANPVTTCHCQDASASWVCFPAFETAAQREEAARSDAEFIIAAVNALPELLNEVEAHRKVAAELRAFIADRDQLLAIAEAARAYRAVAGDDRIWDATRLELRERLYAAVDGDDGRK